MSQAPNRYDPDKHDDFVPCPRSRCAARNAPPESDDFRGSCWKCDADLPREHPVEIGDTVTVDVTDIHESGEGVGHTEEGFVILIDGVLPETTAKVEITSVHDSYARADLIEKDPEEAQVQDTTDQQSDEDEEDDDPALGSRDNFWG